MSTSQPFCDVQVADKQTLFPILSWVLYEMLDFVRFHTIYYQIMGLQWGKEDKQKEVWWSQRYRQHLVCT